MLGGQPCCFRRYTTKGTALRHPGVCIYQNLAKMRNARYQYPQFEIAVAKVSCRCFEQHLRRRFPKVSYGGRPKRTAHHAIANLQHVINGRKVNWIFEADLKNFFGSLNQDWVKQFLNHRVGDPRIATLIQRWLKAGIRENGQHIPTELEQHKVVRLVCSSAISIYTMF